MRVVGSKTMPIYKQMTRDTTHLLLYNSWDIVPHVPFTWMGYGDAGVGHHVTDYSRLPVVGHTHTFGADVTNLDAILGDRNLLLQKEQYVKNCQGVSFPIEETPNNEDDAPATPVGTLKRTLSAHDLSVYTSLTTALPQSVAELETVEKDPAKMKA